VKKKQAKRSNVVRVESDERDEGNVIDLVQILKKSLSGKSK
jgi:non-homologous end joining protein Ku